MWLIGKPWFSTMCKTVHILTITENRLMAPSKVKIYGMSNKNEVYCFIVGQTQSQVSVYKGSICYCFLPAEGKRTLARC